MRSVGSIDRCIVVGAGITGLTLAWFLKRNGVSSVVIEQSPGLGGRLATRRIGRGVFDHGAQFLTAHDARFRRLVADWESRGIIREWCRGFPEDTGPRLVDGHVRYKAVGGMTSIAKHLAGELEVHLSQRATELRREGRSWVVRTATGETFGGDALVLTPPVPQSLELLDTSNQKITTALRGILSGIEYDPCVCVLALLSEPSNVPEPGAIRFAEGPVAFLADNHRKGISPDAWGVTLHTSAQFAREHWDERDEDMGGQVLSYVGKWVSPSSIREVQVKRWRYSLPLELYPEPALRALDDPPLILAGDGFGGPRVEGAVVSALAAVGVLLGHPAIDL